MVITRTYWNKFEKSNHEISSNRQDTLILAILSFCNFRHFNYEFHPNDLYTKTRSGASIGLYRCQPRPGADGVAQPSHLGLRDYRIDTNFQNGSLFRRILIIAGVRGFLERTKYGTV